MSSDNYLPQMVLPEPKENITIDNEDDDPLVSKADDSEGEVTMEVEDPFEGDNEIIREEMKEDIMSEEEPEPIVKPKRKLKNDEVFKTPKIQPIQDPPKKKRVPTQKQLDALAKARENMKARREEIKKMKEEGKDVPKSKRKQRQEKQVESVIEEKVKEQNILYTEEHIAKITSNAIEQYEVKRKARKEIKKKKQEEEAQQLQVQRQVQRAMGNPAQDDIWGQALAGLI